MSNTNIGKTKRSTDNLIDDAINRQQSWLARRRQMTRKFLQRFNVFKTTPVTIEQTDAKEEIVRQKRDERKRVLKSYWFPITCALIVILLALFIMLFKINTPVRIIAPSVPEPIVRPVVAKKIYNTPSFDLVRIEKTGNIIVAGRNPKESNISVVINKKVVATVHTNKDGEFVYAPNDALKPGNYVISLIDTDKNIKSEDSV